MEIFEEWFEQSMLDDELEEMAEECGVDASEILLTDFMLWLEGRMDGSLLDSED